MLSITTIVKGSILAFPILASAAGQLGFSLGLVNSDNSCKSTDELAHNLEVLKAVTGTTIIRTYAASSDPGSHACTLDALIPALKATGTKVIAGIWPIGIYEREIDALSNTIRAQGGDQIYAVTVGSESLYREAITPQELAGLIRRTKGVLLKLGVNVPVGFADSWNLIVEDAANPAIEASDIVLANCFPFWQGVPIQGAVDSFNNDITQAFDHVQRVNSNAAFWVGETNWPTGGGPYGAAVPSTESASTFWKSAICGMLGRGIGVFVFEAFDEPQKPLERGNDVENYWGVFDVNHRLKYDLRC